MCENLENIWKSCTAEVPKAISESWWKLIVEKYSESERITHNYHYLEEKMEELDNVKHHIKNLNALTLALFFQYLEYSPKDSQCHEKNLESFYKFASEAGISSESDLYKEVKNLLEASAVHSTDEHKTEGAYGESDLHYFLDLDMCILGSSQKKYAQHISAIHEEYSFLDAATYNKLRRKVLQSFLLIPNIFATKEFRKKYDAQARQNIQEELNKLQA